VGGGLREHLVRVAVARLVEQFDAGAGVFAGEAGDDLVEVAGELGRERPGLQRDTAGDLVAVRLVAAGPASAGSGETKGKSRHGGDRRVSDAHGSAPEPIDRHRRGNFGETSSWATKAL